MEEDGFRSFAFAGLLAHHCMMDEWKGMGVFAMEEESFALALVQQAVMFARPIESPAIAFGPSPSRV